MIVARLLPVAYRLPQVAAVTVGCSALSWAVGDSAITIDLSIRHPPQKLPAVELFALVTAILAAALLRPRFWEWERLGGSRTKLVATGVATLGMLTPLAPVLTGVLRVPDGTPWVWLLSNALILGAAMFALSALFSPALGGGALIAGYFSHAVIANLVGRDSDYLVLTGYPGPSGNWFLAITAALAAAAIYGGTHGSTSWAQRLTRNES